MKRTHIHFTLFFDRKWLCPLFILSAISLFLILIASPGQRSTSNPSLSHSTSIVFDSGAGANRLGLPELSRLVCFIYGTGGDGPRLKRLLQNCYLLHLDLTASDAKRLELAKYVKSEAVLRKFKNVMVVGKANLVTYNGPTTIACTLHAIAILLKQAKWDWFINLSASDYPLLQQDG
ncbi:hypothetical protein U1Q18_013333 [Sarracenia purpurea var. burkii]